MLPIFDGLRDVTLASVTTRMLLAVLCGGLIGIERAYKRRPAGFRTHILICLGAAITTLTSQFLYLNLHYYTDMARLGAQVVAGIGFIGAGTIVVTRQHRVKGLTTAAGLWASAIIGLALGGGFYEGALLTTVLVLVAESFLSRLEYRILDHVPGARERAQAGEILFGTVDSWLVWKLTGGKVHVTDRTNASRTMLYNIRTLDWDDTLLKALDIPRCILPSVKDSSEVYGYTNIQGVDVPVAGIAGDQQAALFGQGCFKPGDVKNTYGTGCFLLMNTGNKIYQSKNGLVTTIAISLDGEVEYALEGSVFVGGAVIQWIRDGMHLIQDSCDSEYYAQKVPDNGGVYIVPAFTGLGAPYWDMYARGAILGITRGTTQNHIIRAAEESIAYQSADLMWAMEKDTDITISTLKVDGGASRDHFLMQFQSDILNKEVLRPAIRETTALGAAYLAGLATGVWKDRDEIRSLWHCNMTFTPAMPEAERARLLSGWHKAVGRSSDWAEH